MIEFKEYNAAVASDKYAEITNLLYTNGAKPKLDNAANAFAHLGVENDERVMAFVSVFKNQAFADALVLGNYECVADDEITKYLFLEIGKFAKGLNIQKLIGPMNGDTWHGYRFSVLDKASFFLEANHKRYYLNQWQNAGFSALANYQTNRELIQQNIALPDYNAYFNEKGITIRHFNMHESAAELKLLHSFCSELFQHNLYFSPISEEDFVAMYQPILPLLNPNLIYYFMDKDEMVGLLFAIENRFNPKEIIVKTIARHPAEKYKGLAHMFSALFHHDLIEMGVKIMLHAYFHVDNNSAKVSSNYGGEMYQQHVLLSKSVQ